MNHTSKTNNYTDFFYYAFRNILLVSVPLVIISALALSLPHSSAESSVSSDVTKVDNITLTLNVSCTLSAIELTPHVATFEGNGLHREDIGTTKVGVFCNDNNGYNIYAIGYSNNTDGNTDLIVDGLSSDYNIKTGIYSSGSTISSWGMKLTAGTGTGSESERTPPTINNGYNSYNVIPNVYTLVASRASGTNMNPNADLDLTGSFFTTTYDIYASSAQPAGTYDGKVKYILTHPNTNAPNTINDIDAAFASAGKQKAYRDEKGSYYAMQDMTSDICASINRASENVTTQLVDIRDNKLYYVTKLKDGHCWMTQNLDLDIGGTGVAALTSENTDISTDPNVYTNSGVYSDYNISDGIYTWNPIPTAITSNTIISGTTVSPAWPTDNYAAPYSAESNDIYYYTSNTTSNDTRYDSLQACKNANHTEAECKHYFVGNYYNWSTAIASNDSTNIGDTNGEIAANSICPKGWKLPNASRTNNKYNEFGTMLYEAGVTAAFSGGDVGYKNGGFNKIRSNPYYFVRAGEVEGSRIYGPGLYSGYWSNTVSSSTQAYLLLFNNTVIYPANSNGRSYGWHIRCMARHDE